MNVSKVKKSIYYTLLNLDSADVVIEESASAQAVTEDPCIPRNVHIAEAQLLVSASPQDNEK